MANKKRTDFINEFKNNMEFNKYKLPNIVTSIDNDKYHINSWVHCTKVNMKKVINTNKFKNKFPKKIISCMKIIMILNTSQKYIINKWFNSYITMYNETLKYVRDNCHVFKNDVTRAKLSNIDMSKYGNLYYLRNVLYDKKNEIKLHSSNNVKDQIQTHTLDYAISLFVSNLKSAYTNTNRGNFKKFKMKFMKYNKKSKVLEIEKQYIKNNMVCPNILGDIAYKYNNKAYIPKITSNVKINYNTETDEYRLLIPIRNIPNKKENKPRNIIVLDPGIRTFMTGLTEKEGINIGINVIKVIETKIKTLNKIKNNPNIKKKIKKKNEKIINRKIYNKVDDLHWKTIKCITDNFNNVLIGNMSAKQIVKKSNKVLSNDTKTACLRARYYEFRQRLSYKCSLNKVNYVLVDEKYTSKLCSMCGNYNEKLKGEKIYNCKKCNIVMDRDINACRNIFMRSLMK